ncbi:MAG: DUF2950 domain-containing protein [Phycisphaerales bacterium]
MYQKINIYKISVFCSLTFIIFSAFNYSIAADNEQKLFSSAEEAVEAFIKAVKENNNEELLKIFGRDANELIYSGDEIADKERRKIFIDAYDANFKIENDTNALILIVGKNEWPFPIPIIKKNDHWIFDTAAGKEEILNRRIGYNELSAIQVLHAIVDAQMEYAAEPHDNNGLHVYARKFRSDPNKQNGLYWETKEGQKPSPLGPLVTSAQEQGYFEKSSAEIQPYHGYYYQIITSQGENASGGAYDYIVNGKMIGGFAVVAWPANYGNSGVTTFIVNHDGIVYQKDLGENTESKAMNITVFDPDKSWIKADNKDKDQYSEIER